ncbi:uncharacterized protein [Nicotiana tomentosiformis]|uniref:uncharacterized protein n=1 Tax=Nicotiana tomentosiformis TaxID=4098 RepID=UPI00388CE6B6
MNYSIAYHPQNDGQTERMNRCIENYLICIYASKPTQWKQWLSSAKWWDNTNFHAGLQCTPFEATWIGNVAYKLELPSKSKVHPVFRVSFLKKKKGNKVVAQITLPFTGESGQFQVKPIAILQRQMVKKNNITIVKVLVQWFNLSPEDATWEDYQFLKDTFPDFDS